MTTASVSDNRAKYPELAAAVDAVRAVFGPNVSVKRPYVLKSGEYWFAIPTQEWPCKALMAKPLRRAGGR